YLGIAAAVRGGSAGGPLLWLALAVAGVGLGLTIPPLLTQSLVGVPLSQAADASGLVTTAAQLSQVIGVAGFGTGYLSLAQRAGGGLWDRAGRRRRAAGAAGPGRAGAGHSAGPHRAPGQAVISRTAPARGAPWPRRAGRATAAAARAPRPRAARSLRGPGGRP